VIRRIVASLVTIAAVTTIACVDMSAPKGAASISQLLLPSPSVVVGDTMRDSTGAVKPLNVIAYDGNSVPISGLATTFFITDSGAAAHLTGSHFVIGDKQGTVHVVGQVSGIQTAAASVPVTVAPTALALASPAADTLRVPVAKDTSASIGTLAIGATLKGKGDTAALGFIVKYDIASAPATIAGSTTPAIFIGADPTKASPVDTSDASGVSRSVIVRPFLLANEQQYLNGKADSVVILISTSYRGVSVAGSPIRVVLPLKLALSIQ